MTDPEEPAADVGVADLEDVRGVVGSISAGDRRWRPGSSQTYGSTTWRPELESVDPKAALHVHLADRLRPYVIERLNAAAGTGHEVHVALSLSQLYDEGLVEALARIEAQVHLITEAGVQEPRPILTVVADHEIRVSIASRLTLGRLALDLSRQPASTHVRGRRFEALLLFMLSQIRDFRVKEHNYRTDTEELDGVVQQSATGGRLWASLAAPFMLLEAKNWSDRVDQREVSILRVKMQGRRRSVRIGLLCGASGFTSDARDQEMRFASEDLTIIFIGPEELDDWADALDADEYLETIIRRGMLR